MASCVADDPSSQLLSSFYLCAFPHSTVEQRGAVFWVREIESGIGKTVMGCPKQSCSHMIMPSKQAVYGGLINPSRAALSREGKRFQGIWEPLGKGDISNGLGGRVRSSKQ